MGLKPILMKKGLGLMESPAFRQGEGSCVPLVASDSVD